MAKRTPAPQDDEISDFQSEAKPPQGMDLVGGLTFVTFIALLIGMVLAQKALAKYFGAGLFA